MLFVIYWQYIMSYAQQFLLRRKKKTRYYPRRKVKQLQGNVRVHIAMQSSTYICTTSLPQSVWFKTNYGFHVAVQGRTRKVQSEKVHTFCFTDKYYFLLGSSMQNQGSEETVNPSQPREASGGGPAAHHCPWFLGCLEPPWGILSSSVPVPALQEPLSPALCRAQLAVSPSFQVCLPLLQAEEQQCWILESPSSALCAQPCPRAQPELALLGSCPVPAWSRSFPDTP